MNCPDCGEDLNLRSELAEAKKRVTYLSFRLLNAEILLNKCSLFAGGERKEHSLCDEIQTFLTTPTFPDHVLVRRDKIEPVIQCFLEMQEDPNCTCWICKAARDIKAALEGKSKQ